MADNVVRFPKKTKVVFEAEEVLADLINAAGRILHRERAISVRTGREMPAEAQAIEAALDDWHDIKFAVQRRGDSRALDD